MANKKNNPSVSKKDLATAKKVAKHVAPSKSERKKIYRRSGFKKAVPYILMLFALVLACVIGLLFHFLGRGEGARAFPFGPSIAVAAAAMLLYGAPLVAWYRGLLM